MALMSSPGICYTWVPPLEHQLKEKGPLRSDLADGNKNLKNHIPGAEPLRAGPSTGPHMPTH